MGDTPTQLTLWPAAWWHNPALWRARALASTVHRPTEDQALDNLYYESRALRRRTFLPQLDWLQRRIFNLDIHIRTTMPHYATEHDRARYIALRLRGKVAGPEQVKAILRDVSRTMREIERLEAVAEKRQRRLTMYESICEVTAEDVATRQLALAA